MENSIWFWILIVLLAILFFWLFVMKIFVRFPKKGEGIPCPFSLSWIVDNPIRRWDVRNALKYAGLCTGDHVLELGPGPGAFTIIASKLVGDKGNIIAVDIQPEMIAKVKARLEAQGIKNVETHVASGYQLPIQDSTLNRAFMVTVLPEVPDPVRCLREVKRVLKPGGIVSLTEEFFDPDYPRRSTTKKWAEAAGLKLVESHGNWWCYTLNFKKEESPIQPKESQNSQQ